MKGIWPEDVMNLRKHLDHLKDLKNSLEGLGNFMHEKGVIDEVNPLNMANTVDILEEDVQRLMTELQDLMDNKIVKGQANTHWK